MTHKFIKYSTTSLIALLLVAGAGCADAKPGSSLEKAEIETIIHDYLMENPELIRDAMIALEKKEETAVLAQYSKALYDDPRDVSIGPKNAKVTIVEFFDYNCGYCKKSSAWIKKVIETHPNDVRVIFKETPILDSRTKTSSNAAKAAIAAHRQGKYTQLHFAMMEQNGLTQERIETMAKKGGINIEQLKTDMKDPKIDRLLADTMSLAGRIPMLSGTPFFLINGQYLAGADENRLQSMLDDALKGS